MRSGRNDWKPCACRCRAKEHVQVDARAAQRAATRPARAKAGSRGREHHATTRSATSRSRTRVYAAISPGTGRTNCGLKAICSLSCQNGERRLPHSRTGLRTWRNVIKRKRRSFDAKCKGCTPPTSSASYSGTLPTRATREMMHRRRNWPIATN